MSSATLPPPIVSADWLAERSGAVLLADVRWYADGRSPAAEYRRAHLPGAVFVDLDRDLAGPASPADGRHPLPDPESFAAAMGRLGIGDDTLVAAYDDAGGVIAARLVWMLRVTGHPAALLDGGITGWDGPVDSGPVTPATTRFRSVPWPAERIASIDEVATSTAVVLDARDRARYRGDTEPLDARAGHLPGARNLPCRDNVDGRGRLLPADVLRARFAALGIDQATTVISSCGSGVTACHTLLALEHVGLGSGRLYPGSWSQWSADPARPAVAGDEPT